MDRVFVSKTGAQNYFHSLGQEGRVSHSVLADELGVAARTLWDWRNGVYSFPWKVAKGIEKKYGVALPKGAVVRAENDIKSRAGRRGAIVRNRKYGNPGTLEGRRKGGRRSLITHRNRGVGFRLRKSFPTLTESAKLAEFLGIMLGDGGVTKTQIRISLNSRDDKSYSQYVCQLMHELFSESPSVFSRRRNTLEIVLSGEELVEKLNKKGLVIGNKIEQGADIPNWVFKKRAWQVGVLRGLFDTDGSIYLDKHTIKGQRYSSACVALTSYSRNLLDDICESLFLLGFSPTTSTKNSVLVRKQNDVVKFFGEIDPANEKHQKRFRKFMEE